MNQIVELVLSGLDWVLHQIDLLKAIKSKNWRKKQMSNMSELNQELKDELEKIVADFLENEQNFLNEPNINGIKMNFLYNLKNGVDVKITVGRNLDDETE